MVGVSCYGKAVVPRAFLQRNMLSVSRTTFGALIEQAPLADVLGRGMLPGQRVQLKDLKKKTNLNGKVGVVQEWDEDLSCWTVALESGAQVVQAKPENLSPLTTRCDTIDSRYTSIAEDTTDSSGSSTESPPSRKPLLDRLSCVEAQLSSDDDD